MGKQVAVISSGDAGVYGMAGLVYEVLLEKRWTESTGIEVETIPGISAINSCASLLGAPIMHDACTISLSDHLTPWDTIIKRVEAAAQSDFVIALYNPRSGRRTRQIVETQNMLLRYRSPETPVGLVKSAYRERQQVVLTTLEKMLDHDIGMLTTVIIGNSTTFVYDGKMITPRGYQRKYTLDSGEQRLKPHERLRKESEPWALDEEDDVESDLIDVLMDDVSPLQLAEEALSLIDRSRGLTANAISNASVPAPQYAPKTAQELIFEVAVSPGVANKKFTPKQLFTLAQIAGDRGEIEYTPHHYLIIRVPTSDPDSTTNRLRAEGFQVQAIGDVITVKGCDFCNGEKTEAIPYAEELQQRLGGISAPKELHIAVNGCGMACYRAANEDIGIIYRKGKFDLFLGAKTTGSNAHTAQRVAEGIEPEQIVETIERIVQQYQDQGHPNERFYKYFKRVKVIQGFEHKDAPVAILDAGVCVD